MAFLMPFYPSYPRGGRVGSRLLFRYRRRPACGVADPGLDAAHRAGSMLTRPSALVPAIGHGQRLLRARRRRARGRRAARRRASPGPPPASARGSSRTARRRRRPRRRTGPRRADRDTARDQGARRSSSPPASGRAGWSTDVPLSRARARISCCRGEALGNPTAAFNVLLPGSINRFVFALPATRRHGAGRADRRAGRHRSRTSQPVTADDEQFLLEMLSTGLRHAGDRRRRDRQVRRTAARCSVAATDRAPQTSRDATPCSTATACSSSSAASSRPTGGWRRTRSTAPSSCSVSTPHVGPPTSRWSAPHRARC